MPRHLRLTGLLLLAAWLPAMLHCQIEAAAPDLHWLGAHDHNHADDDDGGGHSVHWLDQQHFKPVSLKDGVKAPPPLDDAGVLVPAPRLAPDFRASPGWRTLPARAKPWRFLARAVAPAQAP